MMIVAMMVQICSSPGQTFAVSAFTPALRDGLGLSNSSLSLAYMLGTFLAAFPLSLIGPLSDRWGLRRVTTIVIAGLSLTCFMASMVVGFWGLFAVFLMLRFLGQGALTLLGGHSISMWFRTKLGRVSAVMSIGTAIAFAWVPQWLAESIVEHGWRATFVMMATIVAVVMFPTMLFLFRNRPEDLGLWVDGLRGDAPQKKPSVNSSPQGEQSGACKTPNPSLDWELSEANQTPAFWIMAATNAIWAMVGTGVVFHLFTLCSDRGFSPQLPPSLFKAFGLSMLAMQLLGGILTDFLVLRRLLGIGVVMLTLGMIMICQGDSQWSFYCYAIVFGAGQGLLIAINSVIWVRYYGREHLGKIRGMVWCMTVAGSGCGPFFMGLSRDHLGSFEASLWGFTALMSPLTLFAWFADAPRKS